MQVLLVHFKLPLFGGQDLFRSYTCHKIHVAQWWLLQMQHQIKVLNQFCQTILIQLLHLLEYGSQSWYGLKLCINYEPTDSSTAGTYKVHSSCIYQEIQHGVCGSEHQLVELSTRQGDMIYLGK